jgi:hypothetical protein
MPLPDLGVIAILTALLPTEREVIEEAYDAGANSGMMGGSGSSANTSPQNSTTMIQSRTLTLSKCVCDNCKEDITFGEGWVEFEPHNLNDWIDNDVCMKVIDGKHYCYDCMCYDEEGNLIIIESRFKHNDNEHTKS